MPLERLDEVLAVVPRSLLLDGAHDPDGRHIGELDGRHARSHVGEDVLDDGLGVRKDKGLLQLDVSCGRHENLQPECQQALQDLRGEHHGNPTGGIDELFRKFHGVGIDVGRREVEEFETLAALEGALEDVHLPEMVERSLR